MSPDASGPEAGKHTASQYLLLMRHAPREASEAAVFVLGGMEDVVPVPAQGAALPISYAERLVPFATALALLLLATALFMSAYFHYDSLLMPKRFWAPRHPPAGKGGGIAWRPPSSDVVIMYQNMQRIWFRTFVPAVVLTGAALVCLAYSAGIQQLAAACGSASTARWIFGAGITVVALLVSLMHWRAKPAIGVQD